MNSSMKHPYIYILYYIGELLGLFRVTFVEVMIKTHKQKSKENLFDRSFTYILQKQSLKKLFLISFVSFIIANSFLFQKFRFVSIIRVNKWYNKMATSI